LARSPGTPNNYWAWWYGFAVQDTVDGMFQQIAFSNDTTLRYHGSGHQASDGEYRDDIYAFENGSDTSTVVVVSNHTSSDKYVIVSGLPTTYTKQHSWRADTTTTTGLAVEDSSTCWVSGGTGLTELYVPHRSVVIALMQK
jgi:hypothetical protein